MISKTENTFKHEYDQNNTINDKVKAIKAMQLIIRSE